MKKMTKSEFAIFFITIAVTIAAIVYREILWLSIISEIILIVAATALVASVPKGEKNYFKDTTATIFVVIASLMIALSLH